MVLAHTTHALGEQLYKTFEGSGGYGQSLKELLADVSAEQASNKPIKEGRSIWEIVLHIIAREDNVRQWITGTEHKLMEEENWPLIFDYSEEAWQDVLKRLLSTHDALTKEIALLSEEDLLHKVKSAKRPTTLFEMIQGVIRHNIYHAGQIAMLKRVKV
jgi:uncharacterized damage-inducible protein DinB